MQVFLTNPSLTDWDQVTYPYVSIDYAMISSDNDLSPVWGHAIIDQMLICC